jgi:hypothetical protein
VILSQGLAREGPTLCRRLIAANRRQIADLFESGHHRREGMVWKHVK